MLSIIQTFGVYLFWPIWILITTTAAICAAVLIKPNTARDQAENQTYGQFRPHVARIGTSGAVTVFTLLAVLLVCCIAMILVWEDFNHYDNHFFTLNTLRGYDNPPPIWPSIGRFCPFAFQEFNLIRYFTHTPTGYHIFPIIQLLIFFCIIVSLDADLNIAARSILAIVVLLTPSILISFSDLIHPERNVLFFLTCLILLVKRFEQRQTITLAVAAVVCAQILIYYKDVAFSLLFGFAIGRLILRCRNEPGLGWNRNRLWDKESRLDLCFAALAVLFLVFYAATMGYYLFDSRRYRTLWTRRIVTDSNLNRLCQIGSPCLAICGRRGEQDLFNPALSGGSILVVGRTGCRRCNLLLFLLIFGSVWLSILGTGRSHCCTVCWSVCDTVMAEDVCVE